MNPRIRNAMLEVFNHIDSDLDIVGYTLDADPPTVSSTTQEAVEKLEHILKSFDFGDDEPLPKKDRSSLDGIELVDDNSPKLKGGDIPSNEQ